MFEYICVCVFTYICIHLYAYTYSHSHSFSNHVSADSCEFAKDGVCNEPSCATHIHREEGDCGASNKVCEKGTDTTDCADSCEHANNMVCDECVDLSCTVWNINKCDVDTDSSDCGIDEEVLRMKRLYAECTSQNEGEQAVELCLCHRTYGGLVVFCMVASFIVLGVLYLCYKSRYMYRHIRTHTQTYSRTNTNKRTQMQTHKCTR